jgi:hypothetical protein
MTPSRIHPLRFWSTENGLTGLLIFFPVYLIVVYAFPGFGFGKSLAIIFFTLVVLTGMLATFQQRWLRIFAPVLAGAALALTWISEFWPGRLLAALTSCLGLIYLGFLAAVVAYQVFREGPVTGHRIRGAIVVYLLFGGVWAIAYQFLALLIPGAFLMSPNVLLDDPDSLARAMLYFSFSTLTTLGYGDITPVHSMARLLAMFEALVGQLYPAIILARLVSLAVMYQREKR